MVDLIDGDPDVLPALLGMFRESIGTGSAVFRTAARPDAPGPAAEEVGLTDGKVRKSPTNGSMP